MTKRKGNLGRGLGALLGDTPVPSEGVAEIERSRIIPNPYQPRAEFEPEALAELAASIREYGIIQPLVVVRGEGDTYVLVAGERRLRAAELAGLTKVPAVVRQYEPTARAAIALIENLQREDLNPIEEAGAYYRLQHEFSLSQAEIAEKVGRSRPYVANSLRLLRLHDYVRECLALRRLTVGQVRPLLTLTDPDVQLRWAQRIEAEGWNARQVEQAMAEETAQKSTQKKAAVRKKAAGRSGALQAELNRAEEQLTLALGTKVRISAEGKGRQIHGEVRIDFSGTAELERLLAYFE